jgi:hypothetical protein
MKKLIISFGTVTAITLAVQAQIPLFTPGQLAVLQFGDGGTNRCLPIGAVTGITNYAASDIVGSRQTQYFIDQFDPGGVNQTNPQVQVPVPTNDADGGLFVNGNAGTEGILTLAGDKSRLAFTGYAGTMLSITTGGQTAPSNLSYNRGIGTVDAFGNYTRVYSGGSWYGTATGKTNPRGVATDGAGNFWGCGNGYGSLYYDANTSSTPLQFQNIDLTSCIKVINNTVVTSVKAGDVQNGLYPAGIYTFVDFYYNPVPYPNFLTFLQQYIPATAPYTNCIGFDINPQGTVAYVADVGNISKGKIVEPGGVQKYVRNGSGWVLAYNLEIPGYTNQTSGILANAGNTNVPIGCFSVTVDWSGTNPVIYATTADCGNDNGDPYYGNRVIRINDTNTVANGGNIMVTTNLNILTTVARPGRDANGSIITNIVYKSVTFTPDLRPTITGNPTNWTATAGDTVNFYASASSAYSLSYQWLSNGVPISVADNASAGTSTLTFSPVDLSYNNTAYQCVVTNNYGAVTSAVATLLVYASPVAPSLGALQQVTNFYGNSLNLNANASGTDPKTYQWYLNGDLISDGAAGDGASYTGTTGATLAINNAQSSEAGIYSVKVTNIADSASNTVYNLTLNYAAPQIVVPPTSTTTFLGQNVSFTVSAFDGTVDGASLSYQWFIATRTGVLTPLADGGEYSGTSASGVLSSTLNISGAIVRDATNYVVVVSNSGGSKTNPAAALTLIPQPPHSFVFYSNSASIYFQNFNSLPIDGGTSAEAANPVSVLVVPPSSVGNNTADPVTVGSSVAYSLAGAFDFAYPVLGQGFVGGLGLTNNMAGWYGWASSHMRFGATFGDQSVGGVIDNGQNYRGDGAPLSSITNRALGMIATTSSGYVAFGLGLVNKTTNTLIYVDVGFIGELWRNNPAQQVINFGYAIDPAGTNSTFDPNSLSITWVSGLNVAFPTNIATTINDGTLATNQVNLATNNLAISGWTTNATLWLVWESANPQGGAQNVAIDNLTFLASDKPASTNAVLLDGAVYSNAGGGGGGAGLGFSFTNASGASFSVYAATNLTPPVIWTIVGHPLETPNGAYSSYQFTDPQATNRQQQFYKVSSP